MLLGELGYICGDAVTESKDLVLLLLLMWKVNCQEGLLQGMVSTADLWQRSDVPPQTTHQTLKKVTEPTAHASKPRAKTSKAA